MMAAASALATGHRIAAQFEALDDWENYGAPFMRLDVAQACASSLNSAALLKRWKFEVFPRGVRWIIKRRRMR